MDKKEATVDIMKVDISAHSNLDEVQNAKHDQTCRVCRGHVSWVTRSSTPSYPDDDLTWLTSNSECITGVLGEQGIQDPNNKGENDWDQDRYRDPPQGPSLDVLDAISEASRPSECNHEVSLVAQLVRLVQKVTKPLVLRRDDLVIQPSRIDDCVILLHVATP